MSLVGNTVEHRKFGKGVISDFSNNIVTVSFPKGEKKFVYPDAFSRFLVLKDEEKQEKVLDAYNEIEAARKEQLRIKRQQEERRDRLLSIRTTPQSQAVFDIDPSETEDILSAQTMFSGCSLSGKSEGMPRIPAKLKPNSSCILTFIPQGKTEKEREIAGIFMVGERFYGSKCKDGNITLHPKHRLAFPEDKHILFWKYAQNGKAPRWGRAAFKYINTADAEKIVGDLPEIFKDSTIEKAEEFKKYFFALNHIE